MTGGISGQRMEKISPGEDPEHNSNRHDPSSQKRAHHRSCHGRQDRADRPSKRGESAVCQSSENGASVGKRSDSYKCFHGHLLERVLLSFLSAAFFRLFLLARPLFKPMFHRLIEAIEQTTNLLLSYASTGVNRDMTIGLSAIILFPVLTPREQNGNSTTPIQDLDPPEPCVTIVCSWPINNKVSKSSLGNNLEFITTPAKETLFSPKILDKSQFVGEGRTIPTIQTRVLFLFSGHFSLSYEKELFRACAKTKVRLT